MPETPRRSIARGRSRGLALALAALTALTVLVPAGCSSTPRVGALRAIGMGAEPVVLDATFSEAYFGDVLQAETTIVLSDIAADDLLDGTVEEGQVVHIELLWVPKPGATPVDASATNATIRYIVISRGEIGVYEGGGFVRPEGDGLGTHHVRLLVLDATLRLVEATAGFRDLLTPAQLQGAVTAERDDRETRRLYFAVSQYVTDALDRSVFVLATTERRRDGAAKGLLSRRSW